MSSGIVRAQLGADLVDPGLELLAVVMIALEARQAVKSWQGSSRPCSPKVCCSASPSL